MTLAVPVWLDRTGSLEMGGIEEINPGLRASQPDLSAPVTAPRWREAVVLQTR